MRAIIITDEEQARLDKLELILNELHKCLDSKEVEKVNFDFINNPKNKIYGDNGSLNTFKTVAKVKKSTHKDYIDALSNLRDAVLEEVI